MVCAYMYYIWLWPVVPMVLVVRGINIYGGMDIQCRIIFIMFGKSLTWLWV